MSSIEKHISPILKSQFPDFYRDQGAVFVAFVEEYYKWLETNNASYANYTGALVDGNPLYHSRRMLDYKDIDKTVDQFYVYFKEKYLKNVDFETNISKKRFIKASHDLFGSKGSQRSFELFFNLLYGTPIEIYVPGADILKASDGTWTVPTYLELSRTNRTLTFPGKMITGSLSGATGFVENIITRNINGKMIDVAYLSDVTGVFVTGEIVSDGPAVADAPKVIGSLSSINITSGGEGFSVGEIVTVTSDRGVEGFARIDGVDFVTGIVRFTILYNGWGYSNTAETTVSTKTIATSNVYNSNSSITGFFRNETVSQNLFSFSLTDVSGIISTGRAYRNGDNSTPSLSYAVSKTQNTATIYAGNTATLILNQNSANVFSNGIIYEVNRAKIYTTNTVIFTIGQSVVQSNGSANSVTGIVAETSNVSLITANTSTISSNGIHIGTYLYQSTSNAEGYVSAIPRENYFTFSNVNILAVSNTVGTFNNTSTITMYADSTMANNLGTFTPLRSLLGYEYLLVETNFSTNTRWSSSNTVIKAGTPSVNTTIEIASDIGGKVASYSNVSATANLFAQNSSAIGLTSVLSTFYGNGNTTIYGLNSNSFANTLSIYTGQNADFSVGYISDSETVRIATDYISSNNDGPGSNAVKYSNMLITGVNSGYGYLNTVLIYNSGTSYNNTNIITFTGGNSGAGSFGAGNASLITDASGNIVQVILSSNTGNGIITTPSVSIVNSTGGSTGVGTGANLIPGAKYGFPKYLDGNITTPLIDLFFFETKAIGSISTLSAINPGEDYNANPFTVAYEPAVASLGKRDIILEIGVNSGSFVVGENVNQVTSQSGVVITSNAYSGNTNLQYEVSEIAYSTDGISNTATGVVYSHTRNLVSNVHSTVLVSNTGTWQNTINVSVLTVSSNTNFEPGNKITQSTTANGVLVTSNSTTLIVKNVQGTFTNGSVSSNASPTPGSTTISGASNSSIYKLYGLTTGSISSITNASACTASTTARARVTAASNNTLNLRRLSLFTDFKSGETVIGVTSGAEANVISVTEDTSSNVVGDNAIISANVVASNGTITIATVVDSGFGYENNEGLTLLSLDGLRAASGSANVATQGVGAGYYSSTRGFLDDAKYIHDGEYYQNYSYEIQTSLPLDKYNEVLKQVLHISGKKLFGRVVTSPIANLDISASMTITQA